MMQKTLIQDQNSSIHQQQQQQQQKRLSSVPTGPVPNVQTNSTTNNTFGYTVPAMIEPEPINCVLPAQDQLGALYIGNFECAMSIELLKQHRIRAVLTASIETGLQYAEEVVHFHQYFQAHDNDEYDITQHFEKSFEFIDRHRQYTSVLVHCFAGVSRSATLVVAYLMRQFGWNLQKALWFLKSKRRWVNPNPGFIKQLTSYETSLFGALTQETHLFLLKNDHIFNPKKQLAHNPSAPHLSGQQPLPQTPQIQQQVPQVQQPPYQINQVQQPVPVKNQNQITQAPQQMQPQPQLQQVIIPDSGSNTVTLSQQAYQIYASLPPNQQQIYLQQQIGLQQQQQQQQVPNNISMAPTQYVTPEGIVYQQQQVPPQINNAGPVSLGTSQFINSNGQGIQQQQPQQQIVYINDTSMIGNNNAPPLGVNSNYLNIQQGPPQNQPNQQSNYYNNQPQQQVAPQYYYMQ